MASTTSLSLSLQARDWEALIGVISYSTDPPMAELLYAIENFVKAAATKPSGTTVVTIATTEYVVTRIPVFLYGTTVQNILNDQTANMFTRVMAAVRAANNTADNYISTTLAAADTAYAATATAIRKNGRAVIMMSIYDGN